MVRPSARDGNLFVESRDTNDVLEYDGSTGVFDTTFVTSGSGGLSKPLDLVFGPNGNLFVVTINNSVLEYNGSTGAFVTTFVASGSGGLNVALGLTFGPNGNLFVTGGNDVLEYNGSTGAFITTFVAAGSGGLGEAQYPSLRPEWQSFRNQYR